MNVALATLSISREGGGLFDCVRRLGQELVKLPNGRVEVLSIADEHSDADLPGWDPLPMHVFPSKKILGFRRAEELESRLQELAPDLGHTVGLWSHPSVAVNGWGRKTQRPYLVSPQGMLDPWALQNSLWKKRIAATLFEKRHLREAACLHALCTAEAEAIRAYGLRNPIAIIPNGVDLPNHLDSTLPPPWRDVIRPETQILLYLGRLHPKKGLENLIKAWSTARSAKSPEMKSPAPAQAAWTLVIAGWDQNGHEASLKTLATELRIPWNDCRNDLAVTDHHSQAASSSTFQILFTGPLFGAEKSGAFQSADAFILPSFSEGLPLVALEAWSFRLPVVMTPECNLPEGFAANAALKIEANPISIADGLQALFDMSASDRTVMGERGRTLVEQRFTWSNVARQMREVYEWVLGRRNQPDCVIL